MLFKLKLFPVLPSPLAGIELPAAGPRDNLAARATSSQTLLPFLRSFIRCFVSCLRVPLKFSSHWETGSCKAQKAACQKLEQSQNLAYLGFNNSSNLCFSHLLLSVYQYVSDFPHLSPKSRNREFHVDAYKHVMGVAVEQIMFYLQIIDLGFTRSHYLSHKDCISELLLASLIFTYNSYHPFRAKLSICIVLEVELLGLQYQPQCGG